MSILCTQHINTIPLSFLHFLATSHSGKKHNNKDFTEYSHSQLSHSAKVNGLWLKSGVKYIFIHFSTLFIVERS